MDENLRRSLPKEQARALTTTHKTRPQMEAISSRNLLKVLPWVNVTGGFYRVNRRQVLEIRPGMVTFVSPEGRPEIFGPSLTQMPSFHNIQDEGLLNEIAKASTEQDFERDAKIVDDGDKPTHIFIIVKGKVSFFEAADFNYKNAIGAKGSGQYFAESGLVRRNPSFTYDAIATTPVKVLKIAYSNIKSILKKSADYKDHLKDHEKNVIDLGDKTNRKGEQIVELFSGLHDDEPDIPGTFVAYDASPREYELNTSQTILKIHTKVADLHNSPFNQTEEQVRLTIEELREAQEYEMINNNDFGLLYNADFGQIIQTKMFWRGLRGSIFSFTLPFWN